MANLLLRDLDPAVLKALKLAARSNGRSLQAEIHEILGRAARRDLARTRRLSAHWLEKLNRRTHTDSTVLIREDRDRR